MIVSTAFILCTSWNQWFFFLFNLGVFDFTALNSNFYHFSVVAMFTNCCVNPFIYAVQYDEFKNGLRKVFFRKTTENEISQSSRIQKTFVSDICLISNLSSCLVVAYHLIFLILAYTSSVWFSCLLCSIQLALLTEIHLVCDIVIHLRLQFYVNRLV